MSSTESQIQQIERNIKEANKLVDLGDALRRLENNRDFKRVIEEAYFKEEAVRLVHAKAAPDMQSAESQKSLMVQMDSIGNLSQFFQTLNYRAEMARKAVIYDTEMRDEILAGDLE